MWSFTSAFPIRLHDMMLSHRDKIIFSEADHSPPSSAEVKE
jgi:hypothetical protein